MVTPAKPSIIIKPSPIHGLGGFAGRDFPKGTRVLAYLGEVIGKTVSIERCRQGNPFIFYLNEQFDLDGNVEWNPARFLNHNCSPNCDAEFVDGGIWIITNRAVLEGEELTFDYGYDLEDYRNHPCSCGSSQCRGYIVDQSFFS